MTSIRLAVIIVLLGMPAFADVFMKLFTERQAMIAAFDLGHSNDCVGFDKTDLRGSLAACNAALRETAEVINAGNTHVRADLLGVLAMEYLARSKILDRMGHRDDAGSDCARAVKYAGLIGDRQTLDFFEKQCR